MLSTENLKKKKLPR